MMQAASLVSHPAAITEGRPVPSSIAGILPHDQYSPPTITTTITMGSKRRSDLAAAALCCLAACTCMGMLGMGMVLVGAQWTPPGKGGWVRARASWYGTPKPFVTPYAKTRECVRMNVSLAVGIHGLAWISG